MMKVSLITAVYNGAQSLRETIESALSQTLQDFEYIIVDDGSSDDTSRILTEYAAKDARIKVITNERNLGLTKSLNKGIHAASGEYVARLDAGDITASRRLEKQVAFLNTHPDFGLVGAWAQVVNEQLKVIGEMKYPTENNILQKILIQYNPFVHSSVMMRRSILDSIGGYDESWKYAQDYELFFRIARKAKIANVGEYLVSYRVYPQSITEKKNKQQVLFAIRARTKAIREGQYPLWSYVYLVKPILGYLLPYRVKKMVKKIFHI